MKLTRTLIALFSMCSVTGTAQDKIYKADGQVIEAKVNAVGHNTITYKRHNNPDGPEYTIVKKEVKKIVYENGTTDNFKGGGPGMGHGAANGSNNVYKNRYGYNVLTVTPGAYTRALDETMNDVGIGMTYERLLDDKGHIGVVVPVLLNFTSNRNFNYPYYSSYTYTGSNNYTSFSFMPGVKFYPASSNVRARYSIGGSFFAMFGKEPYSVYDYNVPAGTGGDWSYNLYGMMISNAINVSVTRHFYMEFDVDAGIPFSDNRYMHRDDFDNITAPFIRFSLKMGGRF